MTCRCQKAGKHDELISWDFQVDVFKVIDPCSLDYYFF